ncbi:uncharacterized protein [Panulirus ornatus]|uniref:uncharacterized protein n=1 Tax=Panulirus ornatus TaxID=150431 RepID=UPI003A863486
MTEEDLSVVLGTLVLEGPKAAQGSATSVISTAKYLKWRPGVSRSIIQVACRACDEGDAVLHALQENDATFHLITKFKVTMAGPTPKKSVAMANKLLGFDKKFVYTPRDIKKFTGSEKLRSAFQEPSESCMMAAQESGGSVFNINKWIPKKSALAKKFLRVLSQVVTVKSVPPECQECRCIGEDSEMALTCRKCSVGFSAEEVQKFPEIPQPMMVQVAENISKASNEHLTVIITSYSN